MADENEQFNAHQADLRGRADSLVRAIFVLAGGSLTVSIGFFSGSSRALLSEDLIPILQASWWGLFISILSLASSLVAIKKAGQIYFTLVAALPSLQNRKCCKRYTEREN